MKHIRLFQPASIAWRLVGFALGFVTLAVIVASATLYLIVAGVVREQIDQRLDTQIEGLRSALLLNADRTVALATSLDGPPFDRRGSGWYWQVSGDQVHLTSKSLAGQNIDSPPRPFDWRHILSGEPQSASRLQLNGEDLYLRTADATIGGKTVTISVTSPRSALYAPAKRALLWLTAAMILLGAVLIGGIFLQVRYGLRPLRQLTSEVKAITAGTLLRLPDADVEELRPVSLEINRLVEQNLQRLAETRLHFANLAHGLKTPVASLFLALTPNNDPDGEMRVLVGRLDQRIRHHLARARKTTSSGRNTATLVKPRIDDIMLVLSRIHADRSISTHIDIGPAMLVACDAEDFDEILGNLVDNAFKWAKSAMHISAETSDGAITITIEDDGPGMAASSIADAFLPGQRLDETVPGDGFGLTIANELVQLYGGTIVLQNRHISGLRQTITLPKPIG